MAATDMGGKREMPWRWIGWGAAAFLLLLPLLAKAPWSGSDYAIMGVLLGSAGLLIEGAVRASGDLAYRGGAGVAIAASFLLLWVNGAVGFLGDEDNPANLLFLGVLAITIAGSVIARFRPAGMARAMFATAAAQVLVGVIALAGGLGSPGYAGLYEAVMGSSVFAGLWLLSGGLFRRAAG
jgi:hypothetical protein